MAPERPETSALPTDGEEVEGQGLVRSERYDGSDAQVLIAELQREYLDRYGGPDETEVEPEEFSPPTGRFLVAYVDGLAVGCGGFRRLADGVAEVKRMYVRRTWRGRGLARQLLAALEGSITDAGYREVRLMTGAAQPEAIGLYRTSGYLEAAAGYGIYKDEAGARFFSKTLEPG